MSRRLPPISPTKSAIIDEALAKDAVPAPTQEPVTDVSIDSLLLKGLNIIERTMRVIQKDVSSGAPERESIMNLKDCMSMLHELRKQEKELLDGLSDEELEKVASK